MKPTKNRLLEVVIDLIKKEVDVSQVSLHEIASQADIAKSTVYEYFHNKDELINEAYMYMLDNYESLLLSPLENQTYKSAFIEQYKRIVEVMDDAKSIMESILSQHKQMWYPETQSFEDKIEVLKESMSIRFLEIFQMGKIEGLIPEHIHREERRGHVIQAIITGLLFQYVHGGIQMTEDEFLEFCYTEITKIFQCD